MVNDKNGIAKIIAIVLLVGLLLCFIGLYSCKSMIRSKETIKFCRQVALEQGKKDIGGACYVVASTLKKDKSGYQVLIANTEDTYAILYNVYLESPKEYIIKKAMESKGADAIENLLH